MSLDKLRSKIDTLDEQIIQLLNQRIGVALEIGEAKREIDEDIYVPAREKEVFQRIEELNSGPFSSNDSIVITSFGISNVYSLEYSN